MKKNLRILMLGDIVGVGGRMILQKHLSSLREKYAIDAVIVNGENSNNNGRGITSRIVHFFKHLGIDVLTSGNHIWDQNEITEYFRQNSGYLLRPANYPSECPGVGVTTFLCKGVEVAVMNLQGRVFMKEHVDCPFKTADTILAYLKHKTNIVLVDMHAEATAEKICLAHYLDGRVSAFFGTHTHVLSADEHILPKGTAFITDVGMAGSLHSSIGCKLEGMIERFKTQMPNKFLVENMSPFIMTGAWVDIDAQTGKAIQIQSIQVLDDMLQVEEEN